MKKTPTYPIKDKLAFPFFIFASIESETPSYNIGFVVACFMDLGTIAEWLLGIWE